MNINNTLAPGAVAGRRPPQASAIGTAAVLVLGIAAPFIGAGTLAWPAGWLYITLTLAGSLAGRAAMLRAHPELAAERAGFVAHADTKRWDRLIAPLVIAGPSLITFVAGLNYRLHWPPAVPLAFRLLGAALSVACLAFASWAMIANPFFSSVVRIQVERAHRAISSGPYRFVRHPAYAASILAQIGFTLMLGSLWALIPAAVVAALVVARTALEDRALRAELPGYGEYAATVRYRLLPGVW